MSTHKIELTPEQTMVFDKNTSKKRVERWPNAYTVWLDVGVQHFQISGPFEDAAEADWMRAMLAKAIVTVITDALKHAT